MLTGKVRGSHDAEVVIERPEGSGVAVIVNGAPSTNARGEVPGATESGRRASGLIVLFASTNRPSLR